MRQKFVFFIKKLSKNHFYVERHNINIPKTVNYL